MSNLRNRFLALAIVVMMLVAALSSTASAATTKFVDVDDPDDAKMISLLSAIGIVKGAYADEDGSMVFDSETPVSRQQMALFLARINSANPGAFEPDDSIKLTFTDVKDSTYFLAIKHCYEQGIIEGRDAETFDPLNTVKLDEALAMIVRALGFKDLSYPIETTKKAKELGFALKYADTAGKNELTRIEVMRLLYTYFYSDEQSLEIVKNEITGVQHTVRVPHPVMEKFGISVNNAYIVRANDYTAAVSTTLLNPNGDPITLPVMVPPSLTAREIAEGKDVVLAYNNFKVVTTSNSNDTAGRYVDGYTYSGKWTYMAVSRTDIDLTKDDAARDIVGLKVVYYQDTLAATRAQALEVISYVKGTKTQVDLADKDNATSAKMNGDLDNFTDYSTALTILGKTYNLSSSVRELTDADIYQYGSTTNLAPATTTDNSKLKQLGGFIAKGGNFGLEYVVNDTDTDGIATEFYFIFTPYTVGYHNGIQTGDDWGNKPIKLDGSFIKDDTNYNTIGLLTANPDPSKNITVNDIAKTGFEEGNAYLYTVEGQNLNIFAKLVKRVDKKYPEYIYSDAIGLSGLTISLTGKNLRVALNATSSPSSANIAIALGTQLSAFSSTSSSDVFYIFNHDNAPSISDSKKYGVLTAAPTTVANYLGSGKLMYLYSVWTYANSRVEQFVSEVWLTSSDGYTTPAAGALVSYQALGDYYRIGAFDSIRYLYFDTNGYRSGTNSHYDTYNVGTSNNYLTYNRVDYVALTGIVNSNTQILAAEFNGITYVRSRTLTLAQFNDLMQNNRSNDTVKNIEMITTNSTGTSSAIAVLIQVEAGAFDAYYDTNSYFTITNILDGNYGYGNSSYNLVKGYNYITGASKDLAVENGYTYAVGQVVKLSYERYTTFGSTTYSIADRITTTPAKNAVDATATGTNATAANNRGAFTQPSAILSYLQGLSASTLGSLNSVANNWNGTSGIGGLYIYPVYRLSSGIVYSTPYDTTGGTTEVTKIVPMTMTTKKLELYSRTAKNMFNDEETFYSVTSAPLNVTTAVAFNSTDGTFTGYTTNSWEWTGSVTRVLDYAASKTGADVIISTADYDTYISGVDMHYTTVITGVYIMEDGANNSPYVLNTDYRLVSATIDEAVELNGYCDAISKLSGNNVNYIVMTISSAGVVSTTTFATDRSNSDLLDNDSVNRGISNTAKTQWYVATNNAGDVNFTGKNTQSQTSDIITVIKVIDLRP